jgi:7-keto-8-aminopelargonate synthetase-like enzyme
VDAVRSHAPGFIFTTARPPELAAAARVSIAHPKISQREHAQQRAAVAATKVSLQRAGLPVLATETHIVPVTVGDPRRTTALKKHNHTSEARHVQYRGDHLWHNHGRTLTNFASARRAGAICLMP